MTKMGLEVGIQSIDIANLRTRALRLIFFGNKLTIDDVTQWIEHSGLVEYFPHVMLNGDVAVTQSKAIIQNMLQESGEYWKVKDLM